MLTPSERETAALDKLDNGVNIVDRFANGPADELVPTESGNLPTLAALVKTAEDNHESFIKLVEDTTETMTNLPAAAE